MSLMMMKTNPITPPRELVEQWSDIKPMENAVVQNWVKIATQAAQWGADQELRACCLLLDDGEHAASYGCHNGTSLRAARRPKPPSLKEQAKAELDRLVALIPTEGALAMAEPIRRALEALDD
jgi:hypothetical protein